MNFNFLHPSNRLQKLSPYAFAEVDKLVTDLKKKGIEPIDFGVGDPFDPTPEFILDAIKKGLEKHKNAGYPNYIGMKHYREKISEWMNNRFNVSLNPDTEITSTIGGKEGIFHFPLGFVNPGDYVLMPSPGYPPYKTGTLFASGIPYFYPLLEENNFYPDFKKIPKTILKKTKILWLNYPNSPTGKMATLDFYKHAIEFAHRHNIIIASDECYTEIYFDEKPHSILEIDQKNIIVFQSLSKRSCMTGHRIGWACGDEKIIKIFKQVKTNIDSGTPNFIQEGAIAALSNEKHVQKMNKKYREKRDIMLETLSSIGLKTYRPEATFYIWQRVPEDETSITFAKKLLQKCAIVVTPGEWISEPIKINQKTFKKHSSNDKNIKNRTKTAKIDNPGKNFIRFALVPTFQQIQKASKAIKSGIF
ncbi:aminotransferase class I/II-fold pyridoxal phosphate-dependent enzyme [Candidatus Peregrinibacteria bacterium]|nr:aminotransferase class I/II-fold pyridoxal phosphate-dependent enzyme [Candidatus Peregrinibacteria bacterium]